jgi:hypothetical protein
MRRGEVWISDNGELEQKLDRAKANDLHWALPRSASNSNTKVLDWHACLHIMENADVVAAHLKEFIEMRDALTSGAPAASKPSG